MRFNPACQMPIAGSGSRSSQYLSVLFPLIFSTSVSVIFSSSRLKCISWQPWGWHFGACPIHCHLLLISTDSGAVFFTQQWSQDCGLRFNSSLCCKKPTGQPPTSLNFIKLSALLFYTFYSFHNQHYSTKMNTMALTFKLSGLNQDRKKDLKSSSPAGQYISVFSSPTKILLTQ